MDLVSEATNMAVWEALFKSPAERELYPNCCISRMQDVCMCWPKSLWHPSDKFSLDAGYTLGVCFWWFTHLVIINHHYSTGIFWSSQRLPEQIPTGVITAGCCRNSTRNTENLQGNHPAGFEIPKIGATPWRRDGAGHQYFPRQTRSFGMITPLQVTCIINMKISVENLEASLMCKVIN